MRIKLTKEQVARCLKVKERHPPHYAKARNLQRALARGFANDCTYKELGELYSITPEHARTLVRRYVDRVELILP